MYSIPKKSYCSIAFVATNLTYCALVISLYLEIRFQANKFFKYVEVFLSRTSLFFSQRRMSILCPVLNDNKYINIHAVKESNGYFNHCVVQVFLMAEIGGCTDTK